MTKIKKKSNDYFHLDCLGRTIKLGDKVLVTYAYGGGAVEGVVVGITKCFIKCRISKYGFIWYRKPFGIIVIHDLLGEF